MTPVDIAKNKRDTIRITRDEYNGHDMINLRVFYDAGEGDLRPGKQGLAFKVGLLPEVLSALQSLSVMMETGAGE